MIKIFNHILTIHVQKSVTKFHENSTFGLVADPRSRADGTKWSPRTAFYFLFIKTPETVRYKANYAPSQSVLNLIKGTHCILHCTLATIYIFTSTGD